MLPELAWRVGQWHVVVSLYATALATGVAVGLLVAVARARRPDVVLVLAPLAAATGAGASHAWHAVVHASPGLSSMGGIAAGLAVLVAGCLAARVRVLDVLDAIAPAALLGFGIGRVGCFLAGCCYGRPTSLPWGVVLPELGLPARHPVQLYAAALDVSLAWWSALARDVPGRATARGMIGYGLLRLVLEGFRDPAASDQIGAHGPSLAQLCAVALVATGLCIDVRQVRRKSS